MSTLIRPEISRSNPWWISKERYHELNWFCKQYEEWQLLYLYCQTPQSVSLTSLEKRGYGKINPVELIFENMEVYRSRMDAIKTACKKADPYLADFLFKAVTEDRSFTYLDTVMNIPCSKKMYFNRFRKFYYILDRELLEREKQRI